MCVPGSGRGRFDHRGWGGTPLRLGEQLPTAEPTGGLPRVEPPRNPPRGARARRGLARLPRTAYSWRGKQKPLRTSDTRSVRGVR